MRHSFLIATATFLLAGCSVSYASSGDTVTQHRDLSAFDKLETSGGVNVTLSCGPAAQAVLRGDSEAIDKIETIVEGHTLVVRRSSNWHIGHESVRIDVTATGPLVRLSASSGSMVEAPACAISSDRLDLGASSGAELRVAGKTEHLSAEASSGGTIKRPSGARLDAHDADLRASSGGTVRVCSVGHLDGRASSGGSISTEEAGSGDRSSSSGGEITTRRCD